VNAREGTYLHASGAGLGLLVSMRPAGFPAILAHEPRGAEAVIPSLFTVKSTAPPKVVSVAKSTDSQHFRSRRGRRQS
jgi:hypothetical protein